MARVLSDEELAVIARIKPSFIEIMTDVSRSAERTDLSSGEIGCVKSTLKSLLEIAAELRSYEGLITIEGELTDVGDDDELKRVLRFAVENALNVLDIERKRMGSFVEACSSYPLAAGKARQAMQFLVGTTTLLASLRGKL